MNKIAIYMKIRRDISIPLGKIIKYYTRYMSYEPQLSLSPLHDYWDRKEIHWIFINFN